MPKLRSPFRPALKIFLQTEAYLALVALAPGLIYGCTQDFLTGLKVFLVCFFVQLPFMIYAFWGYFYPKSAQ